MRLRNGVSLCRCEVLATVLRQHQLGRRLRQVYLANVLHQTLHVRERRHATAQTDTSTPDANEFLFGVLHERFVHAPGNVRDAMLGTIERILKLVVTLIPAAFVNLWQKHKKTIRTHPILLEPNDIKHESTSKRDNLDETSGLQ